MVEHITRFLHAVVRVDRHHHRAQPGQRKQREDTRWMIGRHHAEPVACAQAQAVQQGAATINIELHLAVSPASALIDQGFALGRNQDAAGQGTGKTAIVRRVQAQHFERAE